ncbi:hypothetical protein OAS39_04265, partial [Pirellulales bacterium]|nr:hypothetical protein [Pirellulales bacterium]
MQRQAANHRRSGFARLPWVACVLAAAGIVAAAAFYAPRTANMPAAPPVAAPEASQILPGGTPATADKFPTESVGGEAVHGPPTISRLPSDNAELAAAHRTALPLACELIPPEQQPYPARYAPIDAGPSMGNARLLSRRGHVFSVGLGMTDADRESLPALSGRAILSYLHDQFMSIQVRRLKSSAGDSWFFHPRPVAAAISYRPGQPTKTVNQPVSKSLQSYRSLGLFLPEEAPATPENLRTVVLLYAAEATPQSPARFEYVFIRGRRRDDSPEALPELYAFGTADNRKTLHHYQSRANPARPDECTLVSLVYFTKFSLGGLYPAESATRRTEVHDHQWHAWAGLVAYTERQGWTGGFAANVTRVLDAWIDDQLHIDSPADSNDG